MGLSWANSAHLWPLVDKEIFNVVGNVALDGNLVVTRGTGAGCKSNRRWVKSGVVGSCWIADSEAGRTEGGESSQTNFVAKALAAFFKFLSEMEEGATMAGRIQSSKSSV